MVVESSHTLLLHFNCIIVMQLSVNHDYMGYLKCVSSVRQLMDSDTVFMQQSWFLALRKAKQLDVISR